MGRRRNSAKMDTARVVGREDAVGDDRVKVKVEIEAAAEPLNVVDRRDLAACNLGRPLLFERDGLDEDAAERTGDVGTKRGEAAKLEGEGEHPLAHGYRRKDAVNDVGGGVGHAPPGAARADASTLT